MTARPAARRPGKIEFVTVFAVLALVLLFATIVNVGWSVGTKTHAQAAADASSHAAGLRLARALNEVTAVNHLIGELNALCILAFSFGGLELAEPEKTGPVELDHHDIHRLYAKVEKWSLEARARDSGFPRPVGFRKLRAGTSDSGGAIGPSRQQLKVVMPILYKVHAAAAVMAAEGRLPGFLQRAGGFIGRAAALIEENVVFEWDVLQKLEDLARGTLIPAKESVNHAVIPGLHRHARFIEREVPRLAEEAATLVAKKYGARSSLFPNTTGVGGGRPLALPLVREKELIRARLPHSQMVRAATPWVQYWRRPILEFGRTVLPISRFATHYRKSSNHYTLLMSRWQGPDYDTYLHVLKDTDYRGPDKGNEPWTRREGSRRADEHFHVLGVVRVAPPQVLAYPILRQPQPDGVVAVAQVMLYNANPQAGVPRPRWQPRVGYDTLNWDEDVPEYEFGETAGTDRQVREPRVRLNWHARMTPVTLLDDAAGTQPDDVNRVLDRTVLDRPVSNTH